jgi:hypothetical protein
MKGVGVPALGYYPVVASTKIPVAKAEAESGSAIGSEDTLKMIMMAMKS